MQFVQLDDVTLEYDEVGSGDPLLLIHGGLIDTFFPDPAELSIANSHRVISYHRRGYGGSSRATAPFTIGDQAADARALLQHLGVSCAHLAGHSYGGTIALQMALDTPDLVGSLALLEPGLISSVPSGPQFQERLASLAAMYQSGDRAGALDAFFMGVAGPEYRPILEKVLAPGAFERALADSETAFEVEMKAIGEWSFTANDATRIGQPVLSVVGEESGPIFDEVHSLIQQWFPQAEEFVVPEANHMLPYMKPQVVSDGLARFLDRHHL